MTKQEIAEQILESVNEFLGEGITEEVKHKMINKIFYAVTTLATEGHIPLNIWDPSKEYARIDVRQDPKDPYALCISLPGRIDQWLEEPDEESEDARETCCQCEQATQTYREPSDF